MAKKLKISKKGLKKYPKQNVLVPTEQGVISMDGISYPVLGIDEFGNQQMMLPNQNYQFQGNNILEIPLAQNGRITLPKDKSKYTSQDSLKHQMAKTFMYEDLRGGAQGNPISNYGYYNSSLSNFSPPTNLQQAVDYAMQEYEPKLKPYSSAMEKGEAFDFMFNTGKDPRAYTIQEYYRKYDKSKLDEGDKWSGRKGTDFDTIYQSTIGKLPENERRILMNKGRDWYYQNINNPSPGVPSPAYNNTWYGRIWNTNDFNEFDPNNPKFLPPKENGGTINNTNEFDMAKNGIHIKAKNKGTFTKAAKAKGKGVQEFASQVLANKENYSPAMVKKANFARNASKWNKAQDGLEVPEFRIGDEGYYEPGGAGYDYYMNNINNPASPNFSNVPLNQMPVGYDSQFTQKSQLLSPTLNPETGRYDYNQPEQKSKNPFANKAQANIQGGRSYLNTIQTGLQNAPDAAAKAMKGDFSALPSADVSPFVLSGGVTEGIGAKKVDIRLQANAANEFKDAQTIQNRRGYSDSQWGNPDVQMVEHGGKIEDYKTMNTGGFANVETENLELAQLPNGLIDTMYGETHNNGGIKMNLPEGSKILSEKLKHPEMKKSFAKLGKKLETKKDLENLESPISDDINKFTAQLNITLKNAESDKLFQEQEMMKLGGVFGAKVKNEAMNDYMMKYGGMKKAQNGTIAWDKVSPQLEKALISTMGIFKNQPLKKELLELSDTELFNILEQIKIDENGLPRLTSDLYKELENAGFKTSYSQNITPISTSQPVVNQVAPIQTSTNNITSPFNYNIQPNKNTIDPNYGKMGKQKTPTGKTYNPPLDYAGWKNLQLQVDLAHPQGVPTPISGKYYGLSNDKQGLINVGYQEQFYDDMLETPEGRAELAKMWQETGKTLKGKNLKVDTSNLTSLNDKELYDRLNSLRPAYLDSYTKFRKGKYVNPNPASPNFKTKEKAKSDVLNLPDPLNIDKTTGNQFGKSAIPVVFPFNEPYIESPVARFTFNPNLVEPRTLSPDFTEISRDFRLSRTGNPKIDANLFAQTLNAKNQQLAQVRNQNQQIKSQADQFNAGVLNNIQSQQYGENAQFRDLVGRMRGAISTQRLLDRNTATTDAQKQMDYYNFALPTIDTLYGNNPNEDYIKQLSPLNPYLNTTPSTKNKEDKKQYGGKIKYKPKKKISGK